MSICLWGRLLRSRIMMPGPLGSVSVVVVVLVAIAASGQSPALRAQRGSTTDAGVRLRDVAETAGVRFVHQHSPSPEKYYVESAPGGLAVFDYNGDGRPDVFFTNGAPMPSLQKTSPKYSNRLYRN